MIRFYFLMWKNITSSFQTEMLGIVEGRKAAPRKMSPNLWLRYCPWHRGTQVPNQLAWGQGAYPGISRWDQRNHRAQFSLFVTRNDERRCWGKTVHPPLWVPANACVLSQHSFPNYSVHVNTTLSVNSEISQRQGAGAPPASRNCVTRLELM